MHSSADLCFCWHVIFQLKIAFSSAVVLYLNSIIVSVCKKSANIMNSSIFETCGETQLRCYDVSVSLPRRFCLEAEELSCYWYDHCLDCPTLSADPDIARKGVRRKLFSNSSLIKFLTCSGYCGFYRNSRLDVDCYNGFPSVPPSKPV